MERNGQNMDVNEIILNEKDQELFKKWLNLNLNSISWEGRYLDDFNFVWSRVFEANIKLSKQFYVLENILKALTQGPVISWFKWLRGKLICYLFVHQNLTLHELSEATDLSVSEVASILRDFFVDQFSSLEDVLNELFQINNIKRIGSEISIKDITTYVPSINNIKGTSDEEVLKDLEVTLYNDWEVLKMSILKKRDRIDEAEKDFANKQILRKRVKFIRELVILFIIGGILIFSIKIGNKAYEDYLVKKISLFSPQFFWLDKTLSFKKDFLENKSLDIKLDELEKLEKLESKVVFNEIGEAARYDVESDVVLTSVESLPKDFEVANLEQSNYEEKSKGGYRDSRYGRRRAYRVMMTSIDPDKTKSDLINFISKYKIEQVDNVRPGTEIPGGVYFNLYVPQNNLNEFLSKLVTFEKEATILESKTRFGGKKDMSKVFIWIKSI